MTPSGKQSPWSHSVFWRVAAVLIAVQIATGILAVGFTAWYAQDQQRSLASVALAARLDAVSEEIERRSAGSDVAFARFSDDLILDLGYRFPDPIVFLDLDGNPLETIYPVAGAFPVDLVDSTAVPIVPNVLDLENTFVEIVVDPTDDVVQGGYATAPLFDSGGFPVGLLLVQPLTQSLSFELADTNEAFRSAIQGVAAISIFIALLLGAFFTWWLVRPLRNMALTVAKIGDGDYSQRMRVRGENEFAQLSGAINVMTERVEASIVALKESDRIRRELVANVGHDLRTPLAAIQAHLEEAERLRSEDRGQEAEEAIRRARKQCNVLGALVGDLFELSRLESAVPRLHLEPVPIREVISDAVAANNRAANRQSISIIETCDAEIPVITADGTRLLRLLNNLLSNAIRHSSNGGKIEVGARHDSGQIHVSVRDYGEGIASEELTQLFDRYYRGTRARTRSDEPDQGGTGLGLAISKAIAEAHGGSLSVKSKVGEGTVFELKIPVVSSIQTRS